VQRALSTVHTIESEWCKFEGGRRPARGPEPTSSRLDLLMDVSSSWVLGTAAFNTELAAVDDEAK